MKRPRRITEVVPLNEGIKRSYEELGRELEALERRLAEGMPLNDVMRCSDEESAQLRKELEAPEWPWVRLWRKVRRRAR